VLVDRAAVTGLTVDDWYLPADIVRSQDSALHRNPDRPDDLKLGAPRFSEYPAGVQSPATTFRFDAASYPEASQWEGAVRSIAARGINFAGHWLVVGRACGERCVSYALIEWSTGHIFVPDALRAVVGGLPCERTQPVQHRAYSGLLTVTQPDDRGVVTRYFVWDEARGALTEIASYRSSARRYCGGE
jgi:phospholipase C